MGVCCLLFVVCWWFVCGCLLRLCLRFAIAVCCVSVVICCLLIVVGCLFAFSCLVFGFGGCYRLCVERCLLFVVR